MPLDPENRQFPLHNRQREARFGRDELHFDTPNDVLFQCLMHEHAIGFYAPAWYSTMRNEFVDFIRMGMHLGQLQISEIQQLTSPIYTIAQDADGYPDLIGMLRKWKHCIMYDAPPEYRAVLEPELFKINDRFTGLFDQVNSVPKRVELLWEINKSITDEMRFEFGRIPVVPESYEDFQSIHSLLFLFCRMLRESEGNHRDDIAEEISYFFQEREPLSSLRLDSRALGVLIVEASGLFADPDEFVQHVYEYWLGPHSSKLNKRIIKGDGLHLDEDWINYGRSIYYAKKGDFDRSFSFSQRIDFFQVLEAVAGDTAYYLSRHNAVDAYWSQLTRLIMENDEIGEHGTFDFAAGTILSNWLDIVGLREQREVPLSDMKIPDELITDASVTHIMYQLRDAVSFAPTNKSCYTIAMKQINQLISQVNTKGFYTLVSSNSTVGKAFPAEVLLEALIEWRYQNLPIV